MSTKFSYWLRDEDKLSKKSAGCLTGIFQIFNCQFLLTSAQLSGQYHKKSSSADETISLCKQGDAYPKFSNLEHNLSRSYRENSRSSMESSTRSSFSSSSTSCSSLKNILPKKESKSYEQSSSFVKSPRNSTKPTSTDTNQSPCFRESIKDSLFKDLKNVSIKRRTNEMVKRNKVLKPVDSPRPIDMSKMKELEESLEILIKLRDLPRNFHEKRGSSRFSFDGRISKDKEQAITQKEMRRLSLDSMKDSAMFDMISKVNSLIKELEKNTNSRISEASNLQQDLKSNENQTNIVAKLMGLGPINLARESHVKDHKLVNNHKKQEKDHDSLLQSASNSPKSRNSTNPHTKSNFNSRLVAEETQQKMAVQSVEGKMKQKIESAYNVVEKTLQKLEFSFSERALKSPFVGMKPESKSTGIASSQCAKFEVPSSIRKIKASDLRDKKNESFNNADGGQTPTGKKAKSLNSSAKEKCRREGDNSVSPRLQKRGNSYQESKSCTVILSYDLQKNQKQLDNRQQSDSVSPSSRIRQKSRQAQLNEGKSLLFHQTKGKTATTTVSDSKYKQNQNLPGKIILFEELEKIAPQLSSPNSVLDASPYQDDLPLSPLSISSISYAEEDSLPSAYNLKITHVIQNIPSTLSFEKDVQKQENIQTQVHNFIFPGPTSDNNISPNDKYVAEVLLSSSLLTKDSQMHDILEQIVPIEAVEKNNAQMLHKQLVHDVVNEILTRKMEAFMTPKMLSLKLFKELCFEIKYLQCSIDRRFQGKDTVFTMDLLKRSNAWDRFDSEVHVVVLEIERLIFVDLVNEIAGSLSDILLESKQRYRRHLFV